MSKGGASPPKMPAPVEDQPPQREEGDPKRRLGGSKRKDPPIYGEAAEEVGPGKEVGEKHEKEQLKRQKAPKWQKAPKRGKKPKETFIYGNYRRYYGYRIDRGTQEDPRLATFKREWFDGKDCLDIGCNEGLISISIATKFFCQSIAGVDIDAGLIKAARQNLQEITRKSTSTEVSVHNAKCRNRWKTNIIPASEGEISKSQASIPLQDLLKRVSFRHENFLESLHGCSEMYDAILCLSVTKWVQLNWGDDGLIHMFAKIWKLLRPGGILLLEPQPLSSYKKYHKLSETIKTNYENILLQPDEFRDILLDKIGFRSAKCITENLSGAVVGFNRPIIMFSK